LNRSMKPMANGRLGRETASTCAKECHRGGTLPGVTTPDWPAGARADRDPRFGSPSLQPLVSASERTARAAACFASLHRYNMPAHIRAAQQVSRTFPPSATRARASNIVARASTSRPDPANPKNIPPGRDYTASRARGDDFDRRSEADARDPDPSHSRLQAIQAAKGHVHLKGSSMVSLEAPRSLLRPRGNQRVPLRTSWQWVTKLSDAKSCDKTAPD